MLGLLSRTWWSVLGGMQALLRQRALPEASGGYRFLQAEGGHAAFLPPGCWPVSAGGDGHMAGKP